MGNISIRLNMTQMSHVVREIKGKDGKMLKCLIIPIEENKLFVGEKGVYFDMTAIEIKNKVGDSKDTHLLKQNLDKAIYDAMSEEQRNAMPILGNAIQWGRQEPAPKMSESFEPASFKEEEHDDLPF